MAAVLAVSNTERCMRETPPEMLKAGWIKVFDGGYVRLEPFAQWQDDKSEEGRARIAYILGLVKEGWMRGQVHHRSEEEDSKWKALIEYLNSLKVLKEMEREVGGKRRHWQELNVS